MISLAELADDPDFAQPFTISRSTGAFGAGGWIEGAAVPVPAVGIIQPATDEDLQQLPEGDRVTGAMSFISRTRMYLSHTNGAGDTNAATSDRITWNGDVYRLASISPWVDFGFWKAVGVRVKGA